MRNLLDQMNFNCFPNSHIPHIQCRFSTYSLISRRATSTVQKNRETQKLKMSRKMRAKQIITIPLKFWNKDVWWKRKMCFCLVHFIKNWVFFCVGLFVRRWCMTNPYIHDAEYSHVTVSKALGYSDLESSKTFYSLCIDCHFLSKIQKFKNSKN